MKPKESAIHDNFDDPLSDAVEAEERSEDDLWFLPGAIEDEPVDLPPGPRAEPRETAVLDDWRKAEADHAARLACVAGRLGALDERLKRGPEGWRHRLALIEAAELSWFAGDRVAPDRLALWISMGLSGVQDDTAALARVGWAMRRLIGGPGPEVDLSAFLDRRDPENLGDEAELFADRAGGWLCLMAQAFDLHPFLPWFPPMEPRGPWATRRPDGSGCHGRTDCGQRGHGSGICTFGNGWGRGAARRRHTC